MNSKPNQGGYTLPEYPFIAPSELADGKVRRYPIVIVGAGLCGLTAACDFAARGLPVVVLDDDNTVGVRGASSRGIVYAQKTLEIMDRLGLYERIKAKGVQWHIGKTLAGNDVVYEFDAATTNESVQPPFINLQQFYLEWFLVDRIEELQAQGIKTDLRWKNKVAAFEQHTDFARITVETPAGNYTLEADWVLDCSGVNSLIRESLKLDTHPARGIDRWCISDVRFKAPLPIERWTWIEAPFNENRAVWQHLMADDVWRLDFQMDPACDLEYVSRRDVAEERVRRQVGPDVEFEIVWVGPYSYRSQLLDEFKVGRTFFLGDSAHVMSPFGARGGNSAIQDADNLVWKLALVLQGQAPETLLDSYHDERRPAAEFNIMTTKRTSRFLSPETKMEKVLRDAAIHLARRHPFARAIINTGRLSTAFSYKASPLTSDGGNNVQNVAITLPDGTPGVLSDLRRGAATFVGLWIGASRASPADVIRFANASDPLLRMLQVNAMKKSAHLGLSRIAIEEGQLARLFSAQDGDFILIRPDGHLAAHIAGASVAKARAALRKALGN